MSGGQTAINNMARMTILSALAARQCTICHQFLRAADSASGSSGSDPRQSRFFRPDNLPLEFREDLAREILGCRIDRRLPSWAILPPISALVAYGSRVDPSPSSFSMTSAPPFPSPEIVCPSGGRISKSVHGGARVASRRDARGRTGRQLVGCQDSQGAGQHRHRLRQPWHREGREDEGRRELQRIRCPAEGDQVRTSRRVSV